MRKSIWGSIAALSMFACSVPAWAQNPELFDKLDRNQDGVISPDEVQGEGKGLFERLVRNVDANKDGKLSKEEFAKGLTARPAENAGPGGPGGPGAAPPEITPETMLKRLDKNGDGKISRDEAPQQLAERFDRLDADQNGELDKPELLRMMQRMASFAAPDAARPGQAGLAGQPGRGQPSSEMAAGARVLRALDADGNGELSASEIADAGKILAKFDANGDGKIEKDELLAQLPSTPGGGPGGRPNLQALQQQVKAADANGDGKLSKEEAPQRLKQIFGRIDANADGQIDRAELREFLENARPKQ